MFDFLDLPAAVAEIVGNAQLAVFRIKNEPNKKLLTLNKVLCMILNAVNKVFVHSDNIGQFFFSIAPFFKSPNSFYQFR